MAAKTLTGGCYRRTVSGVKSPNTPSVKHTKRAHTLSPPLASHRLIETSLGSGYVAVTGVDFGFIGWRCDRLCEVKISGGSHHSHRHTAAPQRCEKKTTRSLKSSQYCYCVTLEQPMSSYAGMEGTQTMHGSNALMKWMSPGAGPKVMNICSSKHYVSCARCSKRAKHARENLINVLTHHKHQKMKMKKKIRGWWIRVKEIPLWLPYNFKQQ